MKAWLLANAHVLALGDTTHNLPDVPFRLWLRKRASSDPRVLLVREVPTGSADLLLLREMQKSLDHKNARLGQYQAQGAASVLLLESEDIALASPQGLYLSFLRATLEQPRPNLDQVWLIFCGSVYCFSGPPAVMAVNPENFRFGPQFVGDWLSAVTPTQQRSL